jgi:hypothetical protein
MQITLFQGVLSSMRNQVFFSYSKSDKRWLEEIQKGLQPLLRQKLLLLWDETKIQAGEEWQKEINEALTSAKVAVLLMSPDYLASDYIAQKILPPLLNAAGNDGLTILWVAVRSCSFEGTGIERYKALNNPSKPLAALRGHKRDEELVSICQQIAKIANQALDEQEPEKTVDAMIRHENPASILLTDEPIPSRTKIQQIIEEHFDLDACFIRQQELEELYTSALRGERRILQGPQGAGKTALLKQLQKRCEENNISVRYVDFSTAEGQLQTTLWRNVVLALTKSDPGIIKPEEIEKYLDVRHPVSQAVICLDNVDALASNPRISIEQEMVHLGSLVTHYKSAFSVILTAHVDFNVREYTNRTGSPWYPKYLIIQLAELSEQRSIQLLQSTGVTDMSRIAFCVHTARFRLPLDLLLLAYLTEKIPPTSSTDCEHIEKVYLRIEQHLRT